MAEDKSPGGSKLARALPLEGGGLGGGARAGPDGEARLGAGALSRSSPSTERTPHPLPFPLEGKGEELAAAPTRARPTQDIKGVGDYERLTYTRRAAKAGAPASGPKK